MPVIDIAALEGDPGSPVYRSTARELGRACSEFGFFQVVGHAVPDGLIAELERHARAFFALPPARKQALGRDEDNALGYYHRELTKNTPDWKEVFDLGPVAAPELPDDHPANRGLDGVNRWPAGLPGFRETMQEYWSACEGLSLRLLAAVCVSLGLAPDRLGAHFLPAHTSFLRLNHYPPCDDPAPADSPLLPTSGYMGVMVLHADSR